MHQWARMFPSGVDDRADKAAQWMSCARTPWRPAAVRRSPARQTSPPPASPCRRSAVEHAAPPVQSTLHVRREHPLGHSNPPIVPLRSPRRGFQLPAVFAARVCRRRAPPCSTAAALCCVADREDEGPQCRSAGACRGLAAVRSMPSRLAAPQPGRTACPGGGFLRVATVQRVPGLTSSVRASSAGMAARSPALAPPQP